MTVNLSKHRTDILNEYNAVIDPSSPKNWVLFGYEGHNSNVLHVEDSGDGGVEELSMAFNSGKIQYGLCSIHDDATGMQRVLLINWQGEGAPAGRLGVCASHVPELRRQFKGVHLDITARSDDEVEPEEIYSHLRRCTTAGPLATSSFETERPPEPVKEEVARKEQENKRISFEAQRLQHERDELQAKIHTQFEKQVSIKKEPPPSPPKRPAPQQQQQPSPPVPADPVPDREPVVKDEIKPGKLNLNMWEEKTKSQPQSPGPNVAAKSPVSKRWPPVRAEHPGSSDYRKSSPTGAAMTSPSPPPPEPTPAPSRIEPQQPEPVRSRSPPPPEPKQAPPPQLPSSPPPPLEAPEPLGQEDDVIRPAMTSPKREPSPMATSPSPVAPTSPQHHYGAVSPDKEQPPSKDPARRPPAMAPLIMPPFGGQNGQPAGGRSLVPPRQSDSEEEDDDQDWDAEPLEDGPDLKAQDERLAAELGAGAAPGSPVSPGHAPISPGGEDQGLCAQALWDYDAADETEISFQPGDVIRRIAQIDEGWWEGMAPDGTYGMFPANYVQLL